MNYFLTVLKKYSVFEGRARRAEYWYFALFSGIISLIIGIVEGALGMSTNLGEGILSWIFSLAILLPSIAVGVRRMHDVNKRGWFLLIPIYSLILAITEGTKGDNRFGPDPKAAEQSTPAVAAESSN